MTQIQAFPIITLTLLLFPLAENRCC